MSKVMERRGFLKYSAAGAGALALSHLLGPLLTAGETEERPFIDRCTGKQVKGIPTTCTGCRANCGLIAYVRDGQLLKIGGNPAHPVNKGTLCLVGQAGLYTLYDPERAVKPLVRTGKRGQGRFVHATWDEALTLISGKMKRHSGKGVVLETRGGSSSWASRLFLSKNGGGTLITHDHIVSANREAALNGTFGAEYDYPDVANSSFILNFGANPFESDPFGMSVAGTMASRRDNGSLRLVTFDPRLSATAGRSDEWFPLMPGSDAVVALAMARVIMDEGLHNKGFLELHTNSTAASLAAHLSSYTPAAAERISGVPAKDIKRVAVEYARTDRAVLLTGGGVSSYRGGTESERAARLLPIITGKINRPGCNVIPKAGQTYPEGPAVATMAAETFYTGFSEGRQRVGAYIVNGCDPAYSSPEGERFEYALKDEEKLPLIVCIDTHVTDTGKFADVVLPAATYLEEYGLEYTTGPGAEQVIGYRQPVVQPLEESKPYVDILAMLAKKTGTSLGFIDSEDYVSKLAGAAKQLPEHGREELLTQKGFFVASAPGMVRQAAAGIISGKIRLEWDEGHRLPSFVQPPEHKEMKAGELMLVVYSPVTYREGFTENNILLKEIYHKNRALINSATGAALGLKDWDTVSISSVAGKVNAVVTLTPGMHPRAIALARGCGHNSYGNIEKGEKFNSPDPFTKAIWWKNEGTGSNPNRLVSFNMDNRAIHGLPLTRVTIEKAPEERENG